MPVVERDVGRWPEHDEHARLRAADELDQVVGLQHPVDDARDAGRQAAEEEDLVLGVNHGARRPGEQAPDLAEDVQKPVALVQRRTPAGNCGPHPIPDSRPRECAVATYQQF